MPEDPRLFESVDRRDDPHGRPRHAWRTEVTVELRDEGAKRAVHGSTAVARRAGEDAIRRLARERDTFSADDLHELLEREGGPTVPSKAVGGLFLAAAKRGEIEAVGWVTSERPSRHGGPQRLWTGTV